MLPLAPRSPWSRRAFCNGEAPIHDTSLRPGAATLVMQLKLRSALISDSLLPDTLTRDGSNALAWWAVRPGVRSPNQFLSWSSLY
jgi:hypothetical protein